MTTENIIQIFQPLIESGLQFASSERQKANGTYVFKAPDGRELNVYTTYDETYAYVLCKRAQFKKCGDKFYSQLKLTHKDGTSFVDDFVGLCELAMKKIG